MTLMLYEIEAVLDLMAKCYCLDYVPKPARDPIPGHG